MNEKSGMGKRIQELRRSAGLTQEQLAAKIGVSMPSIRNYENGLREPNSKAMAALEQFFHVSGGYLRGDADRDIFLENGAEAQGCLDDLMMLFQSFKQDFDCASQPQQMLAVSVLSGVMQTVARQLLRREVPGEFKVEEICQVFSTVFELNAQGRAELAKRAAELAQLPQYRD